MLLSEMDEHCDSCGTDLEVGQIGDCDSCQPEFDEADVDDVEADHGHQSQAMR